MTIARTSRPRSSAACWIGNGGVGITFEGRRCRTTAQHVGPCPWRPPERHVLAYYRAKIANDKAYDWSRRSWRWRRSWSGCWRRCWCWCCCCCCCWCHSRREGRSRCRCRCRRERCCSRSRSCWCWCRRERCCSRGCWSRCGREGSRWSGRRREGRSRCRRERCVRERSRGCWSGCGRERAVAVAVAVGVGVGVNVAVAVAVGVGDGNPAVWISHAPRP